METEFFILTLLRAEVAASFAIAAVLLARGEVRRRLGPILAYRLWRAVPVAIAASLLPGLAECRHGGVVHLTGAAALGPLWLAALTALEFWRPYAGALSLAWAAGAAAIGLLFAWGEVRVRRDARLGLAGPAVVGIAAPRLVVPSDFRTLFDAHERALIRLHERTHIEEGHPLANLAVAILQVTSWFNPLMHLAAALCRFDQELACDALVLEGRRRDCGVYARALLKAQATTQPGAGLSLASAWASAASHPLEVRLRALNRRPSGLHAYVRGALGIALGGAALAVIVWALTPDPQVRGSAAFFQAGGSPPPAPS